VQTLKALTSSIVEGTRFSSASYRSTPDKALRLRLSHPSLALSTDRVLATVRAVLAALTTATGKDEELVLQVILGPRLQPHMLADKPNDPRTSWFDLLTGSTRPASSDVRASLKTRHRAHGFGVVIRLGARAGTDARARHLLMNLHASAKVAEAAGLRLHVAKEDPAAVHSGKSPWRWPMRLSAPELVSLMGWPLGEGSLPGVGGVHPKVLPPPAGLKDCERVFAVSSAAGESTRLGVSARDSLQHTVLLGPTGAGKSNALLSLIMADIEAGRGVLVIDPKRDLTSDILARVPDNRRDDVVVLDPADLSPVGLNPLASGAGRDPSLVADSILAVLRELFADSWGPRTQDILTGALLTLARTPDATLVWLPALLSDSRFRRKIIRGIDDPLGLEPFWAAYEAMSASQREQAIAPVMNKLRQFLLRPNLRAVLGQSASKFKLDDLFSSKRIVLVSLNKGLIGPESARLLGSLVVAQLWPLILSRAALPPERRHIVSVFIDEVQDYLSLPTDLADALSQARGLGVGFTIAHQYRSQLPAGLRAGIDTNARNKIVFGLNASDAHDMAAMAPELEAADFMLLPRFGIYAQLVHGGHPLGWISGQTLPPSLASTDAVALRAASAARYGRPAAEVEAETVRLVCGQPDACEPLDEPIGRRERSAS
jgi:hypothetical protein